MVVRPATSGIPGAREAVRLRNEWRETSAEIRIIDQIREISSDHSADASTVQLVQSIVANAERLGLVWKMRPGTITRSGSDGTPRVILDGTTQPIRCMSLLGPMMVGTRVIAVLSPPAGCHVIGVGGLTGWQPLSLSGGWTGNARYRTIPSPPNSVQLYMRISPGTRTDGTTIFTMPVGYRPLTSGVDIALAVSSMAGATAQSPHIYISTGGAVAIYGCANAAGLNLDGFFTLDNADI